MKIRCNNCWKHFKNEDELEIIDEGYCKNIKEHTYFKGCPNCKTDAYLMDIIK